MAGIEIEVPEKVEVWNLLSPKEREEVSLFAYLQGTSISDWLIGAISSSIYCDESNHRIMRENGEEKKEEPLAQRGK